MTVNYTCLKNTLSIKSIFLFPCISMLIACGGSDKSDGSNQNIVPTANAGADLSADEYNLVTLHGTGTDTDGSVVSVTWHQSSGTAISIDEPTSQTIVFSAPEVIEEERLTLVFTVTDNEGSTSTDTIEVSVTPNRPPTANAGEDFEVDEHSLVTLSGSGGDSDGTVASILWEQLSGTQVILASADSLSATFSAPNIDENETLEFQISVEDDDGDTATDTLEVIVIRNSSPTANAGEDFEVDERSLVTLSGSGGDSDGTVANILWEQLSGTQVTLASADSLSATFSAPNIDESETLEFQISVEDDDGDIATDIVSIEVTPLYFELTLSDNINKCGTPTEEIIEITFIGADGAESAHSIAYSGQEETHTFPLESTTTKTVKVEKSGRDYIVIDADPSSPLYFYFNPEDVESCGCTLYDIALSGEAALTTYDTGLFLGSLRQVPASNSGSQLVWNDIEICEHEKESVFIINAQASKVGRVIFGDDSEVLVVGLSDMIPTILDGGIPVYSGEVFRPNVQLSSYVTGVEGNNLIDAFYFDDFEFEDQIIYLPGIDAVTDVRARIMFPVDYINFSISGSPIFSASSLIINANYPEFEIHTSYAPQQDLLDGLSYELFDLGSLAVDLRSDQLVISGQGELPFELAYFYYSLPEGGFGSILAPISNGVVDFEKIQSAVSNIEGALYILIADVVGSDTYDAALQGFLRKKTAGATIQFRHVQLGAFPST